MTNNEPVARPTLPTGFMAPGLSLFASNFPEAASILGHAPAQGLPPFGVRLFQRYDDLLRQGGVGERLIQDLDAVGALRRSVSMEAFVGALVADARLASWMRLHAGRVRSLWGVTPIVNLTVMSEADRRLGVEAESLVFSTYRITEDFDIVLEEQSDWLLANRPDLYGEYSFLVLIWAVLGYDVFFFFNDRGILLPAGGYGSDRFGINIDEMRILRRAGKRFYTITYGADNRVRKRTLASGKFNFCMSCPEPGKFCICDDEAALATQRVISQYATAKLALGLALDNIPGSLNLNYLIVDVAEIEPRYVDASRDRPIRILHAPNHEYFKGSEYLRKAVEELQNEGVSLDLDLVSGVTNAELIERMAQADIVADQFIGGFYGQTAIEAMALGKPVLCYVRDVSRVADPSGFPVVNCEPETLKDVLRQLAGHPERLAQLGRQSRAYVERYHSIDALSAQLAKLYEATARFPAVVRLNEASEQAAVPRRFLECLTPEPPSDLSEGMRLIESEAEALTYQIANWTALHDAQMRALRDVECEADALRERVREFKDRTVGEPEPRGEANKWAATLEELDDRLNREFAALRERDERLERKLDGLLEAQGRRRVAALARAVAGFSVRGLLRRVRSGLRRRAVRVILSAATRATARRLRRGRPRTLWGTTPILTLPKLAAADRLLGFDSQSLVYTSYYITSDFDINLKKLHLFMAKRFPSRYRTFSAIVFAYVLLRYDIVHVFCDRGIMPPPGRMGVDPGELAVLRGAGKRVYTYTYGADVRCREATLRLGEFNICANCPKPGHYCMCDDEAGGRNIVGIARHATAMLAMGDMLAYVPGARNMHFWPLDVGAVGYVGVGERNGRPLRIAHAPNHPEFKGTHHLEAAVERLAAEGHAVELVRVQGVPNGEVLQLFASCDIVADQFVAGFHGYTAIEAMALGKPVMAYLRGPDMVIDPETCPIINASPHTLYDVLLACLNGDLDLAEIGRRSRAYVVRFYSIEATAVRLGKLYLDTADLPAGQAAALERRVTEIEGGLPAAQTPFVPVPWAEAGGVPARPTAAQRAQAVQA